MQFHGFDWDDGNVAKCQKHGLSVEEIESILLRGPRVAPDELHSGTEQRWIAVGEHSSGRPVFIAFTLRTRDEALLARPISARFMHAKEAVRYGRKA